MRKNLPKRKIAFFWLGLIVCLILASCAGKLFVSLSKSSFRWLSRINLLINTEGKYRLLSFENESGFVVEFPANFSKGELFFPVFGEIDASNFSFSSKKQKASLQRLFWQGILGRVKSKLSWSDFVWLYLKSFSLKEEQIKERGFKEEVKNLFKDKQVRSEALALAVFNSTEHLGLAQRTFLLLEASGGRIIQVGDREEKQEKCRIVTKHDDNSYTLRWLRLIYGCEVKEGDLLDGRADLVLILGEEDWKKVSEK